MQIVSTYSVRIKERGQVLRDTAERYRAAVDFYIEIILKHWGKSFEQGMGTKCIRGAEILSVVTAKRPFAKYDFSASFYKFPSYLPSRHSGGLRTCVFLSVAISFVAGKRQARKRTGKTNCRPNVSRDVPRQYVHTQRPVLCPHQGFHP